MTRCHICGKECKQFGIGAHIARAHHGHDPNLGFVTGERKQWNKGRYRFPIDEILVKNRPKPGNLRQILIEIGREYQCETCGQLPYHNGQELTLQVDHIDGDNTNQERTNLRFLCPNCHTQTPTFGWKNRKSRIRTSSTDA